MEDSTFYRALEDRYRGSRELIKGRLQIYLDFIAPLKQIYADCKALDLGCGRGEWLDMLKQNEFSAAGVDLDDCMLEACRERGLLASKGDALACLRSYTDESLAVVSGFHIAEHIPFDDLQVLVKESLRVLKPGGLLILETPNPENITVSTVTFYLDPTHKRPLPPALTVFLTEHYGFARTKILRLQEPRNSQELQDVSLLHVLRAVSPDYGVVAQKTTSLENSALFAQPFGKEYGVTLEAIVLAYEDERRQALQRMVDRIQVLEDKIKPKAMTRLYNAAKCNTVIMIRNSASYLEGSAATLSRRSRKVVRQSILKAMYFALRYRVARDSGVWIFRTFPKLKARLRRLALTEKLLPLPWNISGNHWISKRSGPSGEQVLSPRSSLVYAQLQRAFKSHSRKQS